MVQNIRPPQGSDFPPRQSESAGLPVGGGDSKVEADLKTSTPDPAPTTEQIDQAASRIKEALRGTTSRLEIEVDHNLHKAVVKVFNGESGEIIRQIPSQELLDLAKHLDDPKGLLIRVRA